MAKIITAFWRYEGTHPDGQDHPRRGDLELAGAAFDAWREGYAGVERIAPSRAGCKAEKSAFGRVYAFRIADGAALLKRYGK